MSAPALTVSSTPHDGPDVDGLVRQLAALGTRLSRRGDVLLARGNTRAMTPELAAAITAAKPALLERLAEAATSPAYPCAGCGRFAFGTAGILCWWCRRRDGGNAA